jgi:hypothetical protein
MHKEAPVVDAREDLYNLGQRINGNRIYRNGSSYRGQYAPQITVFLKQESYVGC